MSTLIQVVAEEVLAQRETDVLRKDVGDVVSGRDPYKLDLGVHDKVADPVVADPNVFGAGLHHNVVGKCDAALVVAVDSGGLLVVADFGQQLSQPHDFLEAVSDGDVFSLGLCMKKISKK